MEPAVKRRILLAATASDAGKTTLTVGLIRALVRRGHTVASAKIGPDYIDPMYHRAAGARGMNLDSILTEAAYRRHLLAKMEENDIVVMEGAMGFYDGIGSSRRASACEMAIETDTPVILITSGAGKGLSLAAEIAGFRNFSKNTIAGVILNKTKPSMYGYYKKIIEDHADLPLLGCIPRMELEAPSRNLGLMRAEEWADFDAYVDAAADDFEAHIDMERLWLIAERTETESDYISPRLAQPVRCALAQDAAFCFYYEDVLREAEAAGVEWVRFSPLLDPLPKEVSGLYLGGGYPELYSETLAHRHTLADEIRAFYETGGIVIAEGGGFAALQETIDGVPTLSILPGRVESTDRLQNFGYYSMHAQKDGLLLRRGEQIGVHEFHYSRSSQSGEDFWLQKPLSARNHVGGYHEPNAYLGYAQLHFTGNISVFSRWLHALEEARVWDR